jgi:hypothetical protein
MPYGDRAKEHPQRFASLADLDEAQCTAEEREEYEPHIVAGNLVFAGVDYGEVLRMAEAEADIIVWDGGNNDFPFVKPDLHITVVDALRPRQISTPHPGEAVDAHRRITPALLRTYAFDPGSMAPKVEAACRFAERTGRIAGIGAIDQAEAILAGMAGTIRGRNRANDGRLTLSAVDPKRRRK